LVEETEKSLDKIILYDLINKIRKEYTCGINILIMYCEFEINRLWVFNICSNNMLRGRRGRVLKLPVQSVPITTDVDSLSLRHFEQRIIHLVHIKPM
jgi:hypothetical protein